MCFSDLLSVAFFGPLMRDMLCLNYIFVILTFSAFKRLKEFYIIFSLIPFLKLILDRSRLCTFLWPQDRNQFHTVILQVHSAFLFGIHHKHLKYNNHLQLSTWVFPAGILQLWLAEKNVRRFNMFHVSSLQKPLCINVVYEYATYFS